MTGGRAGGKTNPVPPPRKRGRPLISDDGTKLVVVGLWMTPTMREALRRAAAADDQSMSGLVRRILVRAVELEVYL